MRRLIAPIFALTDWLLKVPWFARWLFDKLRTREAIKSLLLKVSAWRIFM